MGVVLMRAVANAWAMLGLPLGGLRAGRDGRRVGSRQLVLGLQVARGVMALLVIW